MNHRSYGHHRDHRDDGCVFRALVLAVALSAPVWGAIYALVLVLS